MSINSRAKLHVSRVVSLAGLLRQQAATYSASLQDILHAKQQAGQGLAACRMELTEVNSHAIYLNNDPAKQAAARQRATEAVRNAELRLQSLSEEESRVSDSLTIARKDAADAAQLAEALVSRVSDRTSREATA